MDSPTSVPPFVLELTNLPHPRRRLRAAADFRIEYDCGDNNNQSQDPEADYKNKHCVHRFTWRKKCVTVFTSFRLILVLVTI
jgi:hypothetical protein